jgi:hypothetical protein
VVGPPAGQLVCIRCNEAADRTAVLHSSTPIPGGSPVAVSLSLGRDACFSCRRPEDRPPPVCLPSTWRGRNRVAQSGRLLSRRMAFGEALASRTDCGGPGGRRSATPRHGRLTICATTPVRRVPCTLRYRLLPGFFLLSWPKAPSFPLSMPLALVAASRPERRPLCLPQGAALCPDAAAPRFMLVAGHSNPTGKSLSPKLLCKLPELI